MADTVVVFDFDGTIIDCDSDYWLVDGLGATELFERLLPTMPFNTLMVRRLEPGTKHSFLRFFFSLLLFDWRMVEISNKPPLKGLDLVI